MELTTIGKRIAELRKAKGVRQEDLAQHVGVTSQAVSKWENGGVPDTELLPVIAEYFVLCSGNSSTQVRGLVGEVEFRLGERGVQPYNVEGRDNNSWILMDYSNVIVHVFSREARDFYNLDKLYED